MTKKARLVNCLKYYKENYLSPLKILTYSLSYFILVFAKLLSYIFF